MIMREDVLHHGHMRGIHDNSIRSHGMGLSEDHLGAHAHGGGS